MERFWRLLADHYPPCLPAARMIATLGEETVRALTDIRLLRASPLEDGDDYPCDEHAEPDCSRQVVVDDRGCAVAVCGVAPAQCREEVIPEGMCHLLAVDPMVLVVALAEAVGVERSVGRVDIGSGPVLLGHRAFGEIDVRYYLSARCGRDIRAGLIDRLRPADHERVLLIGLHGRLAPEPERTERTPSGIDWVFLNEIGEIVDRRLVVDLSSWHVKARLPGVDLGAMLWPRFHLVLDPAARRHHYAGKLLPLGDQLKAQALLEALAAAPGSPLSHRELQMRLWSEKFSARGGRQRDEQDLAASLRGHVRTLRAALRRASRDGVSSDPIANIRGDDVTGGYVLTTPAERVFWLSQGS